MNPIEEKLKPIQFSETQEEGEPLSFQFQMQLVFWMENSDKIYVS